MKVDGVPNDTPRLNSHNLIDTGYHDTHSITPFHVTVIETISGVIGLDPTEQSLELSKYVSISSIDALIRRPESASDEHAVVSFFYRGHGENLLVVARWDGIVLVFNGDGQNR